MNNIIILLTMTVNPPNYISWLKQRDSKERLNMYEKIINLWLNNTKFKIVVVENTGYKFNIVHERLELITFEYTDDSMNKYIAKGQHEMFSIQYSINNSKFIKDCDYVIKITGRYYMPEFENIINKLINSKTEYIIQ